MSRLFRSSAGNLLVVIVVAVVTGSSFGGSPNHDVGIGFDAADTLASATTLPSYGAYSGLLSGASDRDWFALTNGASVPTCVDLAVNGVPANAEFIANGDSVAHHVKMPLSATTPFDGAIATQSLTSTNLGLIHATGGVDLYNIVLTKTALGGGTLQTGTETIGPGCESGLVPASGTDLYQITLAAGDVVYYSLATAGTANQINVVLLSSSMQTAGPSVNAGNLVGVYAETAGTYYLQVSSSSSSSTQYLMGVIVGPPDGGSGCRPFCIG